MEIATRQVLADFFDKLKGAKRRLLMCDYDGTLAPFRVDRDEAVPYPRVRSLLDEIRNTGTRLAFITGRSADELKELLDLKNPPEIWGCHGRERLMPDGRFERFTLDDSLKAGLKTALKKLNDAGYGDRTEAKYGCLAVHWRGLDDSAAKSLGESVEQLWSAVTHSTGLETRRFDGGLELRAPGRNKGTAVRSILSEEQPETISAYLGDDLTDEDAFKALNNHGLTVLVRDEVRETAAEIRIRPPDELLTFFSKWIEAAK